MGRRTPLADASVNVVVFCLSLMGTDVTDCLSEAWRVLKFDGVVKIAEVTNKSQMFLINIIMRWDIEFKWG